MWRCVPILAALAATTACAPGPQDEVARDEVFAPEYLGIQTLLLEGDLVNFRVEMKGARDNEDVAAYARCAAAQYTLIRGYGFARHVRTNVARTGGVWRGDAVYTISPTRPEGLLKSDAEVTVRDCGALGIPTV